jgi:hypothetical protein
MAREPSSLEAVAMLSFTRCLAAIVAVVIAAAGASVVRAVPLRAPVATDDVVSVAAAPSPDTGARLRAFSPIVHRNAHARSVIASALAEFGGSGTLATADSRFLPTVDGPRERRAAHAYDPTGPPVTLLT